MACDGIPSGVSGLNTAGSLRQERGMSMTIDNIACFEIYDRGCSILRYHKATVQSGIRCKKWWKPALTAYQ